MRLALVVYKTLAALDCSSNNAASPLHVSRAFMLTFVTAALAASVVAQPDTGRRAPALDSSLAVATFDSAWRMVGASLQGRGVTGLDWDAVSRELRPRAARASSDIALRAVIADMLSRLGESHFAILPPVPAPATASSSTASTLGTSGLSVRIVDGRVTVWRVDSAGPAARAGVARGWTVERIDGRNVPPLGVADSIGPRRLAAVGGAMQALRGVPGSRVHLVARDLEGNLRDVSFARDSIRGATFRFGNLPPLPTSVDVARRTLPDGRCVGVVRFEYWMPPAMKLLDRAVDSLRTCAGMVIDLRGNLGGVAAMMMGVSGHFLNDAKTLGTMRTRGNEMRFVANPRRATDSGVPVEPYAGSLAILVDGLSASTSEMFAAGLQALGRARVFGERTPGQALPALATKLPTGDVLMHVVADFVTPDGSRLEGKGVLPNEVVPLTRDDVVSGRDAPLEAALRWVGQMRVSNR
jgi:carboxyl-terminal processing protease